MRNLANKMLLATSGPQSELGDEYYPRPGVHPARRCAAVQPAERAASGLRRYEGRQPTATDGAGNSASDGDLRFNYSVKPLISPHSSVTHVMRN